MISIESIRNMYSKMQSKGVDITSDFLYGYFFVAEEQEKLQAAVPDLKKMSFRFVEIYQSDDNNWWLHVERVESHTAQTLFDLNKKLYTVADKFKIEYDGYDLGNTDPTKAIERDTYVVPEDFKCADYIEDGFPMLLVGNLAFDHFSHKEEFKYFLEITTSYEHDDHVMLPSKNTIYELDDFEHYIENELSKNGIRNYYLIRLTHKGIRTFYLAIANKIEAITILENIKEQANQRDFEFKVIEEKAWKIYEDLKGKLPKE